MVKKGIGYDSETHIPGNAITLHPITNICTMEKMKETYYRYDMVCDSLGEKIVEVTCLPEFFDTAQEVVRQHVHPFYEVVWFTEGEGRCRVDFNEYPIGRDMVFFIAPGQVHSLDSSVDRGRCRGYVLKVSSGLLRSEALSDNGSLLKYNVFNAHDRLPYIRLGQKASDALTRIIEGVSRELASPEAIGHVEYLRSLVKMLIIQFERSYNPDDEQLFSPSKLSHRAFLSFRRDVEHNFRRMHSVKEYAGMLNVTTKTLANYVSECSSFTPLEIINNRITLEAKRLLRFSDYMVKEISFELGFEDPSYFVKFFKRQSGYSPAEYRTLE